MSLKLVLTADFYFNHPTPKKQFQNPTDLEMRELEVQKMQKEKK